MYCLTVVCVTCYTSDIVGVVQSVSPTLSVRRKIDNETIPKRDIVVADDS
jgi:replication factor A1